MLSFLAAITCSHKTPRGTGLEMGEETKSMDEEQNDVNLLGFSFLMAFGSIMRLWG